MKERPFNAYAHEVPAILDGRQTQARRVIKPQPTGPHYTCTERPTYRNDNPNAGVLESRGRWAFDRTASHKDGPCFWGTHFDCPYGIPGDRLWVRESFRYEFEDRSEYLGACIDFKAWHDFGVGERSMDTPGRPHREEAPKWRPPIHMPRWASRILLEVTDVRAELLQKISEEDAWLEGIEKCPFPDGAPNARPGGCMCRLQEPERPYACSFADLWDSINKARGYGWTVNPHIWVLAFKVLSREHNGKDQQCH